MDEIRKDTKMVKAYIYLLMSYVIAFLIAIAISVGFRFLHPLLMILMADIAATIVIYTFSMILKNTSLYDPYWSVAPLIISFYYLLFPQIHTLSNLRFLIVFVLVLIWSIRLTYNWVRQWRGLKHEDWRYVKYRKEKGKNFWLINLIGLQIMPTIQVYLGSISLYPSISLRSSSFSLLDIFAIIITGSAIFIEAIADQQLHNFIKNRKNEKEFITTGLWRYSRHPNYFGEIMFWWGLYLFALSADPSYFWGIIGPICITTLFIFLSIPLMEARNLERKPDYDIYIKQTSRLIPWFSKNK